MNPEEAARKAEELYLDAALMLTRMEARMKRAVRLVMLEKMTAYAAARRVGRHRNNVYRALRAVKPKLDEVKRYGMGAS